MKLNFMLRVITGNFTVWRKPMRNTITALVAAATMAVAAVSIPSKAEARWRGGGVGAGIIGGIAAGAIIAGAANGGYGPGYGPGYGYYGGGPAYGPPCYWQRQRFWDGYGWRIRRVRVCG
jgi:uncharacterized membrane protein